MITFGDAPTELESCEMAVAIDMSLLAELGGSLSAWSLQFVCKNKCFLLISDCKDQPSRAARIRSRNSRAARVIAA